MKKLFKFILRKLFWGIGRHFLSDKWYAKIRYWLEIDSWPDLKNPEKFTEKIQWIKLNERTEIRKKIADRTKVRSYVKDKIGEKYLVPLIGVYNKLTKDIWETLPNQFILKANHGSSLLQIIRNKQQSSFKRAYQKTENWKKTNHFKIGREWVYKDLPKTILAEQLLLDDKNSIPKDYKFFCFHGKVKIIQIDVGRFDKHKQVFFDRDFNRIDGRLHAPVFTKPVKEPSQLDKAIQIAEVLAGELSFIRVDLYLLDDSIYFGELTNFPLNGFVPFQPESLEYKVGSFLELENNHFQNKYSI